MTLHFLKFKADLENIKQLHALPDNKWVVDVERTDGNRTHVLHIHLVFTLAFLLSFL